MAGRPNRVVNHTTTGEHNASRLVSSLQIITQHSSSVWLVQFSWGLLTFVGSDPYILIMQEQFSHAWESEPQSHLKVLEICWKRLMYFHCHTQTLWGTEGPHALDRTRAVGHL